MIRRVAVVGAVCVGLGTGVVVWMIQPVRNRAVVERPSPAGPAPRAESLPPPADAPSPPAAVPRSSRRQPAAAPPADTPDPPASAIEAGTLRIEADVPGAQVFIDRRFIGIAPVTAENLAPGTHQLNVSAEGFEGIARTIDVEPGPRDLTVRFREVRLDAMLPVVHRHRIGSCTGTLVASAQGLRYETTNKEDGFSVALADVETFRVDYQDRNLRVKVHRGREYNFADPDGNADRLFVFHRDVDRARQRLASGDQPASD